ncbi:multifunctional procollagen lysine hydroxylase and glycosyltransferase LH3-like [Watersipora subatra]|uniref:multifunctional procollagen lysine hydroxylase and glycosyltransferase LH3-like n=1 Tax=Watersipora subatra TaxID=2589382 RepID=UPI00355B83ED
MCRLRTLILMCILQLALSQTSRSRPKELVVLIVATDTNHDGYGQFMHSAQLNSLTVETIGAGQKWTGGEIETMPGGGMKINLLKKAVEKYKDREDMALLITDSYDAIMTGSESEIIDAFMDLHAEVVFSAEVFIWPDHTLAPKYPPVRAGESRYLNSGGYMGYADKIYELLYDHEIADKDDDQLYFTNLFIDEYQSQLRGGSEYTEEQAPTLTPAEAIEKMSIKLDKRSTIFQTLNGVLDNVEIKYKNSKSFMYNQAAGSRPLVIHGNGPIKHKFNRLVSYLNSAWTPTAGCLACSKNRIDVKKEADLPTLYMTLMVEETTPFLHHWFARLDKLTYPRDKLDVLVHNQHPYHEKVVSEWVEKNKDAYKSMEYLSSEKGLNGAQAKNLAINKCRERKCEYLLSIDSVAQLTKENVIQDLVSMNKSCVSPMMTRTGLMFSTFWAAMQENGYYASGENYKEIVSYEQMGIWNVPYTSGVQLIKGRKLSLLPAEPYSAGDLFPPQDYDVAFAYQARKAGLFLHVTNLEYYGHLMNPDSYDTSRAAPDLHEQMTNKVDWEQHYLHEDFFSKSVNETFDLEQPCPDVFWFPIVNDHYCDDLILTMETFGKWSGGGNTDERLAGGYENVPTRDIHMNQVGLEEQWLQLLRDYVHPVQLKVFQGYHSTLQAIMNFVVRYRPDEQPNLRPHHDSSTFTVNMALNTKDKDYEGGGVRFLRYDCSLIGLRKGWMLMHPGRLTHFHEGLTTTAGTRYIMVSFVNP